MEQGSGQSDSSKINVDEFLNTMLAYSVEIDELVDDGWEILDTLRGSKTKVVAYQIGYPKSTTPRFEKMYMENRNG